MKKIIDNKMLLMSTST